MQILARSSRDRRLFIMASLSLLHMIYSFLDAWRCTYISKRRQRTCADQSRTAQLRRLRASRALPLPGIPYVPFTYFARRARLARRFNRYDERNNCHRQISCNANAGSASGHLAAILAVRRGRMNTPHHSKRRRGSATSGLFCRNRTERRGVRILRRAR